MNRLENERIHGVIEPLWRPILLDLVDIVFQFCDGGFDGGDLGGGIVNYLLDTTKSCLLSHGAGEKALEERLKAVVSFVEAAVNASQGWLVGGACKGEACVGLAVGGSVDIGIRNEGVRYFVSSCDVRCSVAKLELRSCRD